MNESEIIQILQWTAHNDQIKSIQYITATDEPILMTASADRYVHIWSMTGELKGTLKQGYMIIKDYQWEFPVQQHDSQKEIRRSRVTEMLKRSRYSPSNQKRM